MNLLLRCGIFFLFIFFSATVSNATHIVGGSLTYVYNGGSSYTVTLKLYRDCSPGTASFPNSVNISVVGYDGNSFPVNKNFTMSLGTVTAVPSNLDSCATPPNPMPCVQEGIYTTTVTNLPPNPGGYHLYYQITARNLSLTNVNATCNCIGESFYAYIPGQSVNWEEDFTLGNGTTVDNGSTAWSTLAGTTAPTTAQVNNNLFQITGANNAQQIWTSQTINIASFTTGVKLNVDLYESGTLEANDSILVYYSLNGGQLTLFSTNGFIANDFTSASASQNTLLGNTIQIVIRVRYDGNSPNSEQYSFDNVIISANDFVANNNPVFNLFPPLFLCAGEPFTFDHAATDADGDSLVYEFYTPYDGDNGLGAKDPTFSGNIAAFDPIIWVGGTSATNPLGGTPLNLDPLSGLLSGTPNSIGQYVVGIKVKEYRNGLYLGETLRDFQFNVVNCPPPAQAVLSNLLSCNGNVVSFANQAPGNTTFWWDFGNLASTSDTSILQYPSYTYPAIGTYTATLITLKGTSCADTATAKVDIGWVAASFTSDAPKCVGNTVAFTDNSTKSANSTISGWSWNFGDGTVSNIQNPTHTYNNGGAYSVTLQVTSNIGCQATITNTISIDALPMANAGIDQIVCGNNANTILNGSISNATGGIWTSSGSGTFSPNATSLTATYIPSNADTAIGLVSLTLTTTGNATCGSSSDVMNITINNAPSIANAGIDQIICGVTTATLSASNPAVGNGSWSVVSGAAIITNTSVANTTVTGLTAGSNYIFRWSVSSNLCTSSTDDITIAVDLSPTTANAGSDQVLCNTTNATLAGNSPTVGTGSWSIISGTATITNASSPTSAITGLIIGDSVMLRWTITNGQCSNYDDIKIVVLEPPSMALTGPDQLLCGVNTTTISAITPTVGSGIWSVISGSVTIGNINAATTTLAGLSAGNSYTIRWTISNAICPVSIDDILVTLDSPPTSANAGADQTLCGITSSTLSANNPAVGSGLWTIVSGTGIISTPNSPTTTVTGLTAGAANIFRWTISNSNCTPSSDDVTIYVNIPPTPANAGADQFLCGVTTATISANTPIIGTGVWSVVSGAANITNPNSITTTVTGLVANASYTLRWTINATCPASTDDIVINVGTAPTTANAGADETLCGITTTTLTANTPTNGTGAWTIISGSGIITNITSATTTVTGLSSGATNTFRWTISNGLCIPSYDEVNVYVNIPPTPANAGIDQLLCGVSTATLSANTPAVGTGSWSIVSGAASIINIDSATTLVTGLIEGQSYTFRWTINATCPASIDDIIIQVDTLPTIANAGLDQYLCNTSTANVQANVPTIGAGTWSLIYGTAIITSTLSANTTITGLLPGDSVVARWTITKGFCNTTDDVSIIINPITTTANAGADNIVCSNSNITLNGLVLGGTTTGTWSSLGTGNFSPNDLNGLYIPSTADTTLGYVNLVLASTNNGSCPPVTDTIRITFFDLPIVNAGADQSICSTQGSISLLGIVQGGTTSARWSALGMGIFSPNDSSLSTSYVPSTADISSGVATIILTSSNNGPCPAIRDTINLFISRPPLTEAGNNQYLCNNTSQVQLNGLIGNGYTSAKWISNGTGVFIPNDTTLNAAYTLSANDLQNGAMLYLISTQVGPCASTIDSIAITFAPLANVNAGNNQTICNTTPSVPLNGLINGVTTTGIWRSLGNGSITPDSSLLNASYIIGSNDFLNGFVKLILTSTNNGPCPSKEDTVSIFFQLPANVDAGNNQLLCSNTSIIQLNGLITSSSNSGKWSTSGSGVFLPNDSSLTCTYLPSAADVQNGILVFLTSNNNNGCAAVKDSVSIVFAPIASVNAGVDQAVCSDNSTITLNGSISGVTTTGVWSTSGSGIFSPDPGFLNANYTPSDADQQSSPITFVLSSNNNGVCPLVTDTLEITILQKPISVLPTDTAMCANNDSILLNGINAVTTNGIKWISSGTGTFSPNPFSNPATYIPSIADISSGSVNIYMITINNPPCSNDTTDMLLTIYPGVNADFNASKYTAYIPNDPISFNNTSTNSTSYTWNFGDGSNTNQTSPIHNYTQTGQYTVQLLAQNSYGCNDSITKEIIISGDIVFPTAFTPNPNGSNGGAYDENDYGNDVFFPFSAGIVEFHLLVFNRWGELIFETFDIKKGWDGYYKGVLCQQDTYAWKAEAEFNDGRKFRKKGSITLIR